jgi:hypothetical protein
MKSVFIVLLVAAIGVGVYYYFSQKQKTNSSDSKELILGNWKIDSIVDKGAEPSRSRDGLSLAFLDSSLGKSEFEFKKDVLIFQSLNGKMKDTSEYEFIDDKIFLIWNTGDTAKAKWNIKKLDSAVLILKDQDSASYYFQRMR